MDNKFIVYSHVNKITNVTYVGITKRKPIKVYTLNGELISICESIHEASIKFNVSESGIYYCASLFGGTTKWKGYIFLFESVGNITECCKGNKKSYLGYTFNYK